MLEMAEGEPPLSNVHPMRAIYDPQQTSGNLQTGARG